MLPYPLERGSSGQVSPGVPCPSEEGEVVPLCPKVQEFEGFEQDVERGVVVPVEDESASRADVRPHREGLLDDPPTSATCLTGEGGFHRQHRDRMKHPIVLHPAQERAPSRIVDGLGEVPVALHVPYLQVLKGNQVARRDERVRLFAGKILALPLDLQIRFRKALPGFLPVVRLLLLAREPTVELFEPLLRLAVVARVVEGTPVRNQCSRSAAPDRCRPACPTAGARRCARHKRKTGTSSHRRGARGAPA